MSDKADEIRLQGMTVLETMKPIFETLDGLKKMAAEHGYSETAQEQMAVEIFKSIMRGNGG